MSKEDSGQAHLARQKRKQDHLALCATDKVAFRHKTTLLEQVELVHRALPELDLDEIDLSTEFCGRKLPAPIWMGAITGGADEAISFNRDMARLAELLGIPFCLGSIKPMLKDPSRTGDFEVREVAPTILVMGNLGGTELAVRGPAPVKEALDRLGANGLTVHLNPAMELAQPGGDTDFRGVVRAIADLISKFPELPVVVKETGCGLSRADGELLRGVGVTRVEVAGAGGTSWVGVETLRAEGAQSRLGQLLWDWGIPTAVSTAWLVQQGFEVVAAGGIRTGLDMARALALGAKMTAVAAPIVQAYYADPENGFERVKIFFEELISNLRAIMLIVGGQRVSDLRAVPKVLGPDLTRWLACDIP